MSHSRRVSDAAVYIEAFARLGAVSRLTRLHTRRTVCDELTQTEYFFVTLEKSEKYDSPTPRYRGHWESQPQTREQSPTGQRYIHHAARGTNVMLLVRPRNKDAADRTAPFTFLGPATYFEHRGERPMAILWRLSGPCRWISSRTRR